MTATATTRHLQLLPDPRPEHGKHRPDLALTERLHVGVLIAVLFALAVPLVAALAVLTAPHATLRPSATVLPSHTAERLADGAHQ